MGKFPDWIENSHSSDGCGSGVWADQSRILPELSHHSKATFSAARVTVKGDFFLKIT